MKLLRFGQPGSEKPGIFHNQNYYDVSDWVTDYDEHFFGDPDSAKELKLQLEKNAFPQAAPLRFGPPVKRPGKIICVGLNYRKHAEESGMEVPKEPVLFFKAISALNGPFDDIVIPKNSEKTDWEVELALVIGKEASYVSKEEAMGHVFGYMLHNDVSERAFQLEHGGQWVKGKSADTFAPLGPYLVTADEIEDPHNLRLWLKWNGKMVQDSNTSDFIFDIPTVVSYISNYMTLKPGDIISTGTPSGVGLGLNPPQYLKPGDVVELGIDGLGLSKQKVRAYGDH
ncbi:MAG: fumarylacetoacetate hydrolase family protein [Bacteroidota bacterium]